METNNLADIWEAFLEYIEKNIKNPGFSKWIKPAIPLAITDEIFEIGVDKKFIKDWIDAKLRSEMEGILFELTGKRLSLKVTNLADEQSPSFQPDSVTITNNKPLSVISNSQQQNIAQVEDIVSNLNSKYVFETFVIGNSNRFAHAAALAVAEAPAKVYNPLFLYGDVGLGKTHLMHAIGNRIKKNNPKMKVLYISSEMFTNEMIFSIQKNTMDAFRNKYRNIDCLLIDDIQFLRKKESTQEEFFHTFNALHDANKQIIISSDRKPKEIETLESRLRSRFEWGLTTDIQAPDLETRMAILREKASQENVDIPNDVILFIASSIDTNIREIEGAYIRVVAYSSLNQIPITLDTAKTILSELDNENDKKQITIEAIQQVVANYYKIKMDEFLAKKRTRNVAYPRQIAMYICREITDYSLPRIGDVFGGRDHTTVIHACEKINKERKEDPVLDKTIKNFIEQLKK
ncbi:MAG: chromosomal replication initiator protein DnaA [Acidaminococcaceae bacterium]